MTGVIWTNALITVSAFTFIWPHCNPLSKTQLVCTTLFLWLISFQNTVHWIKCIPGIFYCSSQWCTPPEFYILILLDLLLHGEQFAMFLYHNVNWVYQNVTLMLPFLKLKSLGTCMGGYKHVLTSWWTLWNKILL